MSGKSARSKNEITEFTGFPKGMVSFFSDLKRNNTKEWFEENKDRYESDVREPSRAFVIAMGERLKDLSPYVHAEPKVNRSLFRINRDTRFSKDKTPYKTHMGLWFWDGSRHRMECSGYYFHLDAPKVLVGIGIYQFPKTMLPIYRDSVVHPEYGPQLRSAVDTVRKAGFDVGGQHYKRVPTGYDKEHENAELLLHNGFHVGVETKVPKEFHSAQFVDYCYERFKTMYPVHEWLRDMTRRM